MSTLLNLLSVCFTQFFRRDQIIEINIFLYFRLLSLYMNHPKVYVYYQNIIS